MKKEVMCPVQAPDGPPPSKEGLGALRVGQREPGTNTTCPVAAF